MHARDLIDMAAVIADLGPSLLVSSDVMDRRSFRSGSKRSPGGANDLTDQLSMPLRGMQSYWNASKCRLDRWSRSLRSYADWMIESGNSPFGTSSGSPQAPPEHLPCLWQTVRPVLEEILTGEMLTRVWSAVACGLDLRRGSRELAPIARSVLVGHLEARNRTLNLMVYGQGFGVAEAVEMNRLRRRSERWTDVLLGNLHRHCPVDDFAFDPERVADFSRDLQREVDRPGDGDKLRAVSWQVVTASLRAAFRKGLCEARPNADLNERIAAGILETLPAALFDTQGLPKPLWLMRLYRTADETEGLIEQLLADDSSPDSPQSPDAGGRFG